MADTKITGLTNFDSSNTPYWPPAPASDVIPIVDISDNTMAASGTTKKISINNLLSSSPTATGALTVTGLVTAGSASITGAATVGTTLGVTGNLTVAGNGPHRFGTTNYSQFDQSSLQFVGSRSSPGALSIFSNANRLFFLGDTGGYFFQNGANTLTLLSISNDATQLTVNSTGLNAAGKLAINGASLTYDFNARASSSNVGNTAFIFEQLNGTPIVTMRDNGTVIIAGDIRVGNTVNTVSPTSPNRTITMIVGGVTLYIAAKTTND